MGIGLKILFIFFLISYLFGLDNNLEDETLTANSISYYKYWNPYRRILDLEGEPQSFYGQQYYKVLYNKDKRIKKVVKYGRDRKPKETYHLIWSKSGARSEYKVEFHTSGNTSRLDKNLYAEQLSYVRPGWVAEFKSRSDGRPKKVSFKDEIGYRYYSYNFNYTFEKNNEIISEVVESSYFDSNENFVGRHLLFWEKGSYLRMVQYFNSENNLIKTVEFLHDRINEETVRIISNEINKELERKIIPYQIPDKYSYRYEWDGEKVIDHGLKDINNINLAIEFSRRAEEALSIANEGVIKADQELKKANELARETAKILKKAKKEAKNVEAFVEKMNEARDKAQKAVEKMYDAERDAELARLEVAAATATLGAIEKTKEVEDFARKEAKKKKKEAKDKKKEARKLARQAKIALQDSILGSTPKSFLTLSYGQPFFVEETLEDYDHGINYAFSLGRRKLFSIGEIPVDLGLEINRFNFDYDIDEEKFQTISYYLTAQISPKLGWFWIPPTLETGIKVGGGLISPGYGFTIANLCVFNLLPTPLIIGLNTQFHYVLGVINEDSRTHWTTIGLVFGVNLQDKLPEIFDINFPKIF